MSDVPPVNDAVRDIFRQIQNLYSLLVIARRNDPTLEKEVPSIEERYRRLSESIEELREKRVLATSLEQHTTEHSRAQVGIAFRLIKSCYSSNRHTWILRAAGENFPEQLQLLQTWLGIS